MKYLNENFNAAINSSPKFQDMLKQMDHEVMDFSKNFKDDPKVNSEWGHYYFCNDDGGRLIFDPKRPHDHICEICGKNFTDEVYDGVWVYFYRNEAVLTALKSAVLYKATNDKKYLHITKNIIGFYAENYTKFNIHSKERNVYKNYSDMKWGAGRILPQGLNESIIAIRMINALELLKEDVGEDFLKLCYEKMFREMFLLLKPQVDKIHNIRCWNNSAIGVMGLFFNDKEMIDFAFEGEYNIYRQIQEGVTKDHFWYEGSIHYNFFTLEGITNLVLFAKLYNYKFKEEKAIEKMFIEAYHYAFHNHYFPNPNDGWPSINLKTYSYIYHMATKIFGYDSQVGEILRNILNNSNPRTTIPLSRPYYYNNEISYEHLVLNTDFDYSHFSKIEQLTKNYELSQFGMLRNNNFNLFMKYGLNGASHAHPDIMNIELMYNDYLVSRDMSNPGYQSRLYKEWFNKTLSHNTVVVDGKNMTKISPAQFVDYDSDRIRAYADDIYEGVDYDREIKLNENGIEDTFKVISAQNHTYDYVFHLEKEFELVSELSYDEASIWLNENGYQFLSGIREIVDFDGVLRFKRGNDNFTITLKNIEGKKVFLAKSYDNPIVNKRFTILVRAEGRDAEFGMKLEVSK